jgi:hypothetical protein
VKLGALIRRDGRDPQAMMSMIISSLLHSFPIVIVYTTGAHAKSPASPPGFHLSKVLHFIACA